MRGLCATYITDVMPTVIPVAQVLDAVVDPPGPHVVHFVSPHLVALEEEHHLVFVGVVDGVQVTGQGVFGGDGWELCGDESLADTATFLVVG